MDFDKGYPVSHFIRYFVFQAIQILAVFPKAASDHLKYFIFYSEYQPGKGTAFQVCLVTECGKVFANIRKTKGILCFLEFHNLRLTGQVAEIIQCVD